MSNDYRRQLGRIRNAKFYLGQCAYALRDHDLFSDYIRGVERIEADGGGSFSLHDWEKKWGAER